MTMVLSVCPNRLRACKPLSMNLAGRFEYLKRGYREELRRSEKPEFQTPLKLDRTKQASAT